MDTPIIAEFTHERMIPGVHDASTYWEHMYRYRFALSYVSEKRVLDIACGEGYGSALMAASGAASVIGMDISAETVAHCRRKYKIDARLGSAEAIPLESGSVDLVVSFETIEHLRNPGKFLEESHRVLVSGGFLLVSTPNRELSDLKNPYHFSEMTEAEFTSLLASSFKIKRMFSQCPSWCPWWNPRWLAAHNTPWFRVPGVRKLRNALKSSFCGPLDYGPDSFTPDAILEPVGRAGSGIPALFNQFAVKPYLGKVSERPYYFIALAQRL